MHTEVIPIHFRHLLAGCRALRIEPSYTPALLGAAESWLASAFAYGRMGAVGTAAVELRAAAEHAQRATRANANSVVGGGWLAAVWRSADAIVLSVGCLSAEMNRAPNHQSILLLESDALSTRRPCVVTRAQAAWKMLGDAELQHARVTPQDAQQAEAQAGAGQGLVAAVVGGLAARVQRVKAAGRAYAHALHLDPTQGGSRGWDMAVCRGWDAGGGDAVTAPRTQGT